jgi:hypothetical protein
VAVSPSEITLNPVAGLPAVATARKQFFPGSLSASRKGRLNRGEIDRVSAQCYAPVRRAWRAGLFTVQEHIDKAATRLERSNSSLTALPALVAAVVSQAPRPVPTRRANLE